MTAALLVRTPGATHQATAAGLGFVRRARDRWVRNGFELEQAGAWLALRRRRRFDGDPLRDVLGSPGLWRALPSRRDPDRWDWVFELPALHCPNDDEVVADEQGATIRLHV